MSVVKVFRVLSCVDGSVYARFFSEPPHLNWSTVIFRKRRTNSDGEALGCRGNLSPRLCDTIHASFVVRL